MSKISIIMENTKARVINISSSDLFVLREKVLWFDTGGYAMASAWVKRNQKEKFKKYMIDENGFFPTGIIHRVKDHLESRGSLVEVLDNRIVPPINLFHYKMKCSEPIAYPDQTSCTASLLEARQGIAQVPTGVGKTRIIKDNIQQLGVKSLVLTTSTALKEQMAQYLEDCFGSNNVGIYDKRFDAKPITITNYHSFGNTDSRMWSDYSCLQMDEFHHGSNNTIRDFNLSHLNSFYFRFGLTATNFTSADHDSILLESILSNTVFSMTILEAIKRKYIVPIIPIFYDLPNTHLTSQNDYRKDYKNFIDLNSTRNEIIVNLIDKMQKQNIPSLTLVKHINHGKSLLSHDSVFLNGQDANAQANQKQIQLFNELKIPSIVGTSVIGEGVDTKACGAVINAKGGKSKRELLQNIGRAVRNFPNKNVGFYFDFIDRRQKNLLAHSRKRMRIIEEEFGIKPKIITIK